MHALSGMKQQMADDLSPDCNKPAFGIMEKGGSTIHSYDVGLSLIFENWKSFSAVSFTLQLPKSKSAWHCTFPVGAIPFKATENDPCSMQQPHKNGTKELFIIEKKIPDLKIVTMTCFRNITRSNKWDAMLTKSSPWWRKNAVCCHSPPIWRA